MSSIRNMSQMVQHLESRFWRPLDRKHRWRVVLAFVAILLLLFAPVIRHDYIKTFPMRKPSDQSNPHWWVDPWTLPAESFPKTAVYPDPDWNPNPVWLPHPVDELRSHRPPSAFRCNDVSHPFAPVQATPSFSGATSSSPLLFMGIFSSAGKTSVRNLIRRRQLPHYPGTRSLDSLLGANASYPSHRHGDMGVPPGVLETKFILGYPPGWAVSAAILKSGIAGRDDFFSAPSAFSDEQNGWWEGDGLPWWRRWLPLPWTQSEIRRARDHAEMMKAASQEAALFGDIELLALEDSIVKGKTYHYFRWLAQTRSNNRPPRFAMKTDDDTFHVIPNLLDIFANLSCSTNYYIGTSWGCSQPFPFHFGGLGYALSWPLVAWLGDGKELRPKDTDNQEDARLGSYFTALDREREPVVTLDYSIRMGSFFEETVFPQNTHTIALHYLKKEDDYLAYSEKMWAIWRSAGKPWSWRPPPPPPPSRRSSSLGGAAS
ncbi:unnamed protein product [Parajaminaea phylloscopi]